MPQHHPTVASYAAAINSKDMDALMAIFTSTAELDHPVGLYSGVEGISGFYRDVVLASETEVSLGREITSPTETGSVAVVWVCGTSRLSPEAGAAHAIDVFDLDENGLISRLEIFYR